MKPQRQRDVRCQGFRQNFSGRDCGILRSANKQTEKREVLRLKLSWCCCRCPLLFLLCYYYKHCKYWQKHLLKYLTQLVHDWASASHLAKVLPSYPRHPTSSKYLGEDRCLEPKSKPQEMFGASNTHKVWLDVYRDTLTQEIFVLKAKEPRAPLRWPAVHLHNKLQWIQTWRRATLQWHVPLRWSCRPNLQEFVCFQIYVSLHVGWVINVLCGCVRVCIVYQFI